MRNLLKKLFDIFNRDKPKEPKIEPVGLVFPNIEIEATPSTDTSIGTNDEIKIVSVPNTQVKTPKPRRNKRSASTTGKRQSNGNRTKQK